MAVGRHAVGNAFVAGGTLDGEIRNVRVEASPAGAFVTFEHTVTAGHLYAVAVDGELEMILQESQWDFTLGNLADGDFRLTIYPLRPETVHVPDLHGDPYGRRIYLTWTASTSTDVVKYQIYGYNDTDGVGGDALLDTLDDIIVHERKFVAPDSGTGTGRITVQGNWDGADLNDEYTIQVTASGIRHDLSGSWSTAEEFSAGDILSLPNGVRVLIHDARADYDTNDEWSFRVGPPVTWTSDELAEDTWNLAIKALDATGNSSAFSTREVIRLIYRPEPVTGATATHDNTNITLAWTNAADTVSVNIYANISNATGQRVDDIIETSAWKSVTAPTATYVFDAAAISAEGLFKFYLRPVDAAGREGDSIEMLVSDLSEPPDALTLAAPQDVAALGLTTGQVEVSWLYDWSEGADCDSHQVWIQTSLPMFAGAPTVTIPEVAASYTGQQIEHVWTSGIYADGQTLYIGVRAASGSVLTTNDEYVTVVIDTTAPNGVSGVDGLSN